MAEQLAADIEVAHAPRAKQALIALACQRSRVLFALLRDGTLSRIRHHGICPRPLGENPRGTTP
jgi:hypothetical protein